MKIELFRSLPGRKFELFKIVDLPFLPKENHVYHSDSEKRSFIIKSIHFTDERIMVVMAETVTNVYDDLD
jgi:hypothetical protein